MCLLEVEWAAKRGEDWKWGKRCGEGENDGEWRMEGDPASVGVRKEEQRVSESTTFRVHVHLFAQEKKTALKSVDDFLEWSPARTQLRHVNPSSSRGGRRAAIHSGIRPSSLQSICQTLALLSDTRCYGPQRTVALRCLGMPRPLS